MGQASVNAPSFFKQTANYIILFRKFLKLISPRNKNKARHFPSNKEIYSLLVKI